MQKFIGFTAALSKGEEEAGAGIDFLEFLVLMKLLTADLPQQYPAPHDNSPGSKLSKWVFAV